MNSDEVQFLRDQVHRLNNALSQYQEKYPSIGFSKESEDGSVGQPWVTDKSVLSPLLVEYDANNKLLQSQVEDYQHAQRELRVQVDKLVAENTRLTRDLKEAVRSQLDRLDVGDLQPSMGDDQLMLNLQQQLQMAVQEKDSIMEMWQAACQEVERLEQNTQVKGFDPQLQNLETQANQIKQQYVKTVNELNQEIQTLQEDLAKARTELKASNIQVSDLRHTLQEMKSQLLRKEQERTLVATQGHKAEEKMEEVSNDVRTLQLKIEDKTREVRTALEEKRTLQAKFLELQKKSTEQEQREYEAVLKVRDSMQMAENALMEKDQALVREQQALEQAEKLQLTISSLVDEAGARTRKEVDNVKSQCNDNLARLMEEIHHLEMDNSEKQAQLDRAIREKRSVESELEKIYQDGLIKGTKDGQAYEDMNRRACNAERLRQEAETKLDVVLNQLKRTESTYLDEKTQLQQELEQLKDRMEAVSDEFETINDDRMKFLEELDELKRKLQAAQQEKDAAQRNSTKQITCMERDQKLKAQDYEVRLQTMEDSHRHAMMDLRQMLSSQQRMSAKWKEECQTITHKFEVKVNDLRSEVTRLKQRNEELTKLLKESQEKTKEAGLMLAEYTRNIQRMEDRVREAENRANTASVQISKQMSKARNLMFTTSNAATALGSSSRSYGADPLNLSDLQGGMSKANVTFSSSTRGGQEEDNRDAR